MAAVYYTVVAAAAAVASRAAAPCGCQTAAAINHLSSNILYCHHSPRYPIYAYFVATVLEIASLVFTVKK